METPLDQAADLPARVAQWIAGGETYEVEFKGEQRERLNDRDFVEALVCLADGTGGVLLMGVENDRTVSGARPRHEAGRTDPLRGPDADREHDSACAFRGRRDRSQQEQMILQYVDAHGQITRAEAAELCSLTPDQARGVPPAAAPCGGRKAQATRRTPGIGICQTTPMKPRGNTPAAWLNRTASPRRPFRYLT